jgi:arylsulfatase A-like enzyme/Flp pilus assembly protein TadD
MRCRVLLCILAFIVPALAQKPRGKLRVHRPDVVLITIDTVRADHLGCYGYSNIQTPTLDGLAGDGIVFEHAVSQVPLTWPSHTVILTGTYPFQNGVQDFTGQPLDPRFRSVAQAFQQDGYVTGAVVSSFVLDRSWGLARGFDYYDDAFSAKAFQVGDPGLVERKAGESVTHAIRWLTDNWQKDRQNKTPRPFFLWLHLYDPHSPYDPPEPYHSEYRSHLYDGEIAYADHELGRLITWMKNNKIYQQSLIVALSDHGESLGEHGEQEHGFFIYNSTVHIPLIVKPPAGSGISPGRIAATVETVAVAPTLLQLAGVKDVIEKQFTSPALPQKEANQAQAAARPAYSETFYPFSSFGWSPLHSIQVGHYRYIEAPHPELYDESADPAEANNLISQHKATAAVLKEKLQALLRSNPFTSSSTSAPGLTPEAQAKLQALGYVSFRSSVSSAALAIGLPDPKDKLGEYNDILMAHDAFQVNDFARGEKLLATVEQQDPKMYIVPFMLGESAARRNDWASSATEFRKCLELNPTFDQAMSGLSHALFNLGDLKEAEQWTQNSLKLNPNNWRAWYELGVMQSTSDGVAAMADYEKATAIQANFAPLQRDLGLLQFGEGNYSEAAKHLAVASALGIQDAVLYNDLGICYSRIGLQHKAIASYKQALYLDPNLAQAHLNLGYAFEQLNQSSEANQEYRRACQLKAGLCEMIKQHERKQPSVRN